MYWSKHTPAKGLFSHSGAPSSITCEYVVLKTSVPKSRFWNKEKQTAGDIVGIIEKIDQEAGCEVRVKILIWLSLTKRTFWKSLEWIDSEEENGKKALISLKWIWLKVHLTHIHIYEIFE